MKQLLIAILCLAGFCLGQENTLPDAPQPSPPETAAAPAATCGPKWAGGCWTYGRPQLSFKDTFKSKKFLIPTATLTAFTAWDYATTYYFSRNGHAGGNPNNDPCVERNPAFNHFRPTAGEFTKDFALTHLPTIAFGYFFTKARFPHWIYDGMAAYGVVIHSKGAISWYKDCW